ncbi:MAG TPA: RsmB/NOP family class I SAM-dependent RNA methyltransferase [Usitatibacteraceae bacterium]|nr:RsmB/NOP family class I SAM-dependent RNA methyltransferase [Usitatibacteraceae bacterium]
MSFTPAQFNTLVEALTVVLPLNSPADVQLKRFFKEHAKLGMRDRALIAETVYTVLRHRRKIESVITDGVPRKMALMALTRYQGISARELMPVLKKAETTWLIEGRLDPPANPPLGIAAELPDWVIARLRKFMSDKDILALGRSMMNPAPLDLRVNTFKGKRDAVLAQLLKSELKGKATAISPIGIRLDSKVALAKHPALLEGFIEVQDEGSQLLGLVLEAKRGEMVVDFCAGAGGKALLLGAAMASTGRVYAFDVSEKRLANLAPRLKRSGLSNVMPQLIDSENDARIKRLAGKIDRVLVDAPCTGLGTLRRNPDLKFRQTEAGLAELTAKQASILKSAARLVKAGGRLVYATCSFLPEENEDIVNAFLASHKDFSVVAAAGVVKNLKLPLKNVGDVLRLSPLAHGTDAFFAAILERKK